MPSARMQSLAFVSGLCALLGAGACAGPCAKVERALEAVDARQGPAAAPDLALALPYEVLDRLIAPQLRDLPRARLPLPRVLGVGLPPLEVMVESVRIRPGPVDHVGLGVRVSLRAAGKRLVVARVDAAVPPRVDPEAGRVVMRLAEVDVEALRVSLDATGTGALSAWAWEALPEGVRGLTPRGTFDELVEGLASDLLSELTTTLASQVPVLFDEVAALEIELGGLPVAAVQVRSDAERLQIALTSGLPVSRGLAEPFAREALPTGAATGAPTTTPDGGLKEVSLRVAGETVAALANWAMTHSEVDAGLRLPARYDAEGSPAVDGPYQARARWRQGPRPLVLEVFACERDCAHLELAASPELAIVGEGLEVRTRDARLERVRLGSLRLRAAIFFGGVGRRSFEVAGALATAADFEVGGRPFGVKLVRGAVGPRGVELALQLTPAG